MLLSVVDTHEKSSGDNKNDEKAYICNELIEVTSMLSTHNMKEFGLG
jgi:hypothetical protein